MIFEKIEPRKVFWIAAILMLVGTLLPFVMVLGFLENFMYQFPKLYFLLNIFAFICQMSGFILGIIAALFYVKINRKR
ncbi:MAG: hypothetical protein KBD67_08540 [Anaerolineaceae bacterium]|nr:hypothetical protein [Anaerolineaceae bacterium]